MADGTHKCCGRSWIDGCVCAERAEYEAGQAEAIARDKANTPPNPSNDGLVERALDAIGGALMHAHFALDDSEDRTGESPPVHHIPHENFVDLASALEKCEAFETDLADERTVWEGPGPLAGAIRDKFTALTNQVAVLRAHIAEQITHVETRIADGKEMGASVWRIALEDVARENRQALSDVTPQ